MSYKALYRTYRPTSFDDVAGQQHIVQTLKNAVRKGKIAHAYLFCGPRGTGKTSIAKILAKAVNCEMIENSPCGSCASCISVQKGNHPDIIEIDAASNNGVDEIRSLIEKVKYAPIEAKYKVYIIDEVHMLSQGAFNALLKTLEEPPSHVIFVLATTEPHKVLPTIISRCQRYDFTKVGLNEMVAKMKEILVSEQIEYEEEALETISLLADGGMRDALSILDQTIAYSQSSVTIADVNEIYGITTVAEKMSVLSDVNRKDVKSLLDKVRLYSEKGIDIKRLTVDLIDILKETIIYGYTKDEQLLIKIKKEDAISLLEQFSPKTMLEMIDQLMLTIEKYRNTSNVSSYFEIALLNMMELDPGQVSRPAVSIVEEPTKIIDEPATIVHQKKESQEVKTEEDNQDLNVENHSNEESKTLENQNPFVVHEPLPDSSEEPLSFERTEVKVEEAVIEDVESIMEEGPSLFDAMPEINQTESRVIMKDVQLDVNFVLGLLVQANKEFKNNDIDNWSQLGSLTRNLSVAKEANLLKDCNIGASGENFILLVTPYEALSNEINEQKKNLEIFMSEYLDIKKQMFAISEDAFKECTTAFLEHRKTETLPDAIPIEPLQNDEVKEIEKEETDLDKVFGLFGKENVNVIEEEN